MTEQRRGLTRAQIERLQSAINPNFVETKQGLAYVAQHEVRAELSRVFGFGNWDSEVTEMTCLYERELKPGDAQFPKQGKAPVYWVACYRAGVRLRIRDYWGNEIASFLEYHVEENAPLPSHGEAHAMACTSVQSYALRRAAIGLGDRFGLGLYDKGSMAPLVKGSLQLTDPASPLYVAPAPQNPQGAQPPQDAPNAAQGGAGAGAQALQRGFAKTVSRAVADADSEVFGAGGPGSPEDR